MIRSKTPKPSKSVTETVFKTNATSVGTGKGKKCLVLVGSVFMSAVLKTLEALRNNKEIEPGVK